MLRRLCRGGWLRGPRPVREGESLWVVTLCLQGVLRHARDVLDGAEANRHAGDEQRVGMATTC